MGLFLLAVIAKIYLTVSGGLDELYNKCKFTERRKVVPESMFLCEPNQNSKPFV
jgi:hypothetical protein